MKNGVHQDHSVPNKTERGVGTGVSYPVNGSGSMGGDQYSPAHPGYAKSVPSSHDKMGNSTYK